LCQQKVNFAVAKFGLTGFTVTQKSEAAKVFNAEWEAWKGDQKQTEDVLLIGIKLQ
jgi:hypothetical protein